MPLHHLPKYFWCMGESNKDRELPRLYHATQFYINSQTPCALGNIHPGVILDLHVNVANVSVYIQ